MSNSKEKHTPGKWQVKHSESKQAFNVIGTNLGEKYKIARCPYHKMGNKVADDKDKKETHANALLIATAPDMYDEIHQSTQDLIDLQNALQKTFGNKSAGINDHIQIWIDRKELLIKKTTGDE